MIRLSWVIPCDKAIVDQRTNNISIDTIEQVNVTPPANLPPNAPGIVIPMRLDVVTAWHRENIDVGASRQARVDIVGPNNLALGQTAPFPVDLRTHTRARVITNLAGVPVPLPNGGRIFFVVFLEQNGAFAEVGRTPIDVVVNRAH